MRAWSSRSRDHDFSSAITLAKAASAMRLDLVLGAVLDGMRDVDDRRLEAQRFALRLDAVDEARGDDVDAGKAAVVEIVKVVQTARCAGASIA